MLVFGAKADRWMYTNGGVSCESRHHQVELEPSGQLRLRLVRYGSRLSYRKLQSYQLRSLFALAVGSSRVKAAVSAAKTGCCARNCRLRIVEPLQANNRRQSLRTAEFVLVSFALLWLARPTNSTIRLNRDFEFACPNSQLESSHSHKSNLTKLKISYLFALLHNPEAARGSHQQQVKMTPRCQDRNTPNCQAH